MIATIISYIIDIAALIVAVFIAYISFAFGRWTGQHSLKKWWKGKKRTMLTKWLRFKYRNQDDSTCCCGGTINEDSIGISCNATCKSMKEWVIEEEVRRRVP